MTTGGALGSARPVPAAADLWPAPRADGPVTGSVAVPGSKSVTNRALVIAALAEGDSRLRRPLVARDTRLMAGGLRALGIDVREGSDGGWDSEWLVRGCPGPLQPRGDLVDVGNAGTVARFLPPVAALGTGPVRFDGDPRVRERPVGPLLAALRALGARVDDGGRGALPVTVTGDGRPPRGGAVALDASSSSQLISGLLLIGPRCATGVDVRHAGAAPPPSAPHLAMTVAMLRAAGAQVDDGEPGRWRVAPGRLAARDTDVEPDLSSAAPFLAAAAVTGGTVTVEGWPAATTQPGAALPGLLAAMGATYALDDRGLALTGPDRLTGLDADLHGAGELAPVLAAVCALAATPSRLAGIAHLRAHETDRLAALARGLTALGGDVTETDDGLAVRPRPLAGGTFRTYDDHRLAMAAAVLGLVVPGVLVEDVATTAKTLPGFAGQWAALVAGAVAPGGAG
ncbi:MAG: 3-phosphoshikimate 1-carboxyvinyltransferase [Frankiaceae bacterium]